ncbi:MAG TPA: glutamine--fructose-6-phosphate transaminase (isomerizing) [Candidatus Paceibacterota bacterium]|nr:glutamine--fructose-6-phosphate transaminase (isomerizing) [Candidatus Paceibacterota bacterium]
MCGIVGYTGTKNATPFLIEGLRALEYRGYDSAGIYVAGQGVVRRAGKIDMLAAAVPATFSGTTGIAHTRWATHGPPTETNAHPHQDSSETIWLVHNGIIENHAELRQKLVSEGTSFTSETDTEVLAKLVGSYYLTDTVLEEAVERALVDVRGTYGIAVVSTRESKKIVTARLGSPLLLGMGSDGYYLASDAAPVLPYTRQVIYLDDGELAVLMPDSYAIRSHTLKTVIQKPIQMLDWDAESAKKKGYEHFMLKEIMEIPEVIENTLRGRLLVEEGSATLDGLEKVEQRLKEVERIIVTGCGSAYYAGLVGQELIEEFAGIPVEVEIASELRYRRFTGDPKRTVLIAVSQSGETADTLEALRIAKKNGMLTLGVINVVGSTIARETDATVHNHAGPEIGVASTKAFISQVIVLTLLALKLGRERSLSKKEGLRLVQDLSQLSTHAKTVLQRADAIADVAKKYAHIANALYIGRKYQCPVAYEGALKLKEISYIHAEGYGAGEMKHGPIALIEQDFLTVALAPKDSLYEKTRSNMEEIRARSGSIVAVTTDGNTDITRIADEVLFVPETHEALIPTLTTLPLQLFAYYVAKARGLPIDQPRNLAKAVTVE